MKLRLQLAGMLPATSKLGPGDLPGKATFGATMQTMMPTLPANAPARGVAGDSTDSQSWIPKNSGIGGAREVIKSSAAECPQVLVPPKEVQVGAPFPIVAPDQSMDPSGTSESQGKQSTDDSLLLDEIPAVQPGRGSISDGLVVQASIVKQQLPLISKRSEQQSASGSLSPISSSGKEASSRTRRKAEAADDHATDDQSRDQLSNMPVASQSVPIAVPVPVFQSGELKQASLTGTSEADGSHADSKNVSRRSSTQLKVAGSGEAQDGLNAVSDSRIEKQSEFTVAPISGELSEAPTPGTNAEHSAYGQFGPMSVGKEYAGGVALGNQAHHPQAAESAEFVGNATHVDPHVQKTHETKVGAEREFQFTADPSHHITPESPSQHQAMTHAPESTLLGSQKMIGVHRPQAGAAQVLQRMDMATPSGAVQLRAEVRRLDVGVSSGALGWVEVRATTGASGRVDATLQVQSDASAHVLASQSREISDYAREHSVFLGELSVGVGTGDGARGESRSAHGEDRNSNVTPVREPRPQATDEHTYRPTNTMSFISVRA